MTSTARTLTNKLQTVRNALTGIEGAKVYHYRRPPSLPGSIIWAEESDDGSYLYGDNSVYEQVIKGRIAYWTNVEYDPMVDSIQSALNTEKWIGWQLSSVEYDDDQDLIYFEWMFEVI